MPTVPNHLTAEVFVAFAKFTGVSLDNDRLASLIKMVRPVVAYRWREQFEKLCSEVSCDRASGRGHSAKENRFYGRMWKYDIKDTAKMACLSMRNHPNILKGYTPIIYAGILTRIFYAGIHIDRRKPFEDMSFSRSGHAAGRGATKNPASPVRKAGGS